ncbi:MAG: M23 family metallopeptidase, partial [Chloroflexota bacterium]
IQQIRRQRKTAKRGLKRAIKTLKRTKKPYASATRILRVRAARLRDAEARFPDPADAPDPENWKAKMIRLRRELRLAQDRRRSVGTRIRITTRNRNARRRQLTSLKRTGRVAISRRDSAAGALGGLIVQMTRLAQQRATRWTDVRLNDGPTAFEWPSTGTISQPFGCTGFPLNPPRGSCRYFHRGIDIVSGYGSAVRAAAAGVVAYVGWNPWDRGERAFIVVIGHPGGYVTRYAHIVASRKVRVGQFVRKGQIIARMGSTGKSTGTHVHMELLKGTTPLNPVAYLPTGVVKVREHSDKKGKASRRKASRGASSDRKKTARSKRKSSTASRPSNDAIDETVICRTVTDATEDPDAPTDEAALFEYAAAGMLVLPASIEEACVPEETSPDAPIADETPVGAVPGTPPSGPAGSAEARSSAVRLPIRGTSPLPQ